MPLQLGQLVFTSFAGTGFKLVATMSLPVEVQQAFIERVVYQYWNSCTALPPGYRAAYLHQIAPEQTLFGWLYDDGRDDIGRKHVPYFLCYYITKPLQTIQLENIFTCLHKGPAALIDRNYPPAILETIVLHNFWSYQPVRPGVAIALPIRQHSHTALRQGNLLNLFLPIDEQEAVIGLSSVIRQVREELSIYTHYLVEGIKDNVTESNEDNATLAESRIKHAQEVYQQNLQRYQRMLASAMQREERLSQPTRKSLKHWQQIWKLTDEDVESVEVSIALQTKAALPREKIIRVIKQIFTGKTAGIKKLECS